MDDLEKYKAVNACETLDQLAEVVELCSTDGVILGRNRGFDSKKMQEYCRKFSLSKHNLLTREFGIRQQAMMILFYNEF
tara:strand:+ start:436 stop:672 length:237 start_codon:yes stop_codon:yes gene_type:complete